MSSHVPQPIPRADVEAIYDALVASGQALTLEQLSALVPHYSAGQVSWACGTMTMQGILALVQERRSDRRCSNPALEVRQPFAGYIGWESAK